MIRQEVEDKLLHTWSDANKMIRQIETDSIYDAAYDVIPCAFTYEETDQDIEE